MKKNHAHQRISRNMDPYDASKTKDYVQLQFDRIFWDLINLSVSSSPPSHIQKKWSTTTKTRKTHRPTSSNPTEPQHGKQRWQRETVELSGMWMPWEIPCHPSVSWMTFPTSRRAGPGGGLVVVWKVWFLWGVQIPNLRGWPGRSRVFSLLENIPPLKTNMAMYGKSSIFQLEIHRLIHGGFFSYPCQFFLGVVLTLAILMNLLGRVAPSFSGRWPILD